MVQMIKGQYKLLEKISEGAFKKVYRSFDSVHRRYCVLKFFIPNKKGKDILDLKNKNIFDDFNNEIGVSGLSGVKNLSLILDSFYDESMKCPVSVEEYFPKGDMTMYHKEIKNNEKISEKLCVDYIYQIINGLRELKKFCLEYHADLKFPNILVSNEGEKVILKLTDFGSSGNFESSKVLNVGYPITTAPELLLSDLRPSEKTDVWSLGMILFKMVTGKYLIDFTEPFDWVPMPMKKRLKKYDQKIKKEIFEKGQEYIDEQIRNIKLLDKYSFRIKKILKNSLRINPKERKCLDWF